MVRWDKDTVIIGVTMADESRSSCEPGAETLGLLHKVQTFKSGKVVLSRKYRQEDVREDLVRFDSLFQALAALPILPNLAATLDADLIRRSIFGTAAIEGNPLSEERVGELLAEPPLGLRERAEQEIVNLGIAYGRFASPPPDKGRQPVLVTEDGIREINRVITANIAHEHHSPGQYRNVRVAVGDGAHGGKYTPPKILADIQRLMAMFVEWVNSPDLLREGPLVRAALAHYHLGLIHPFGDGNGRTARLLEAMILVQAGFKYVPLVMSNHYYKRIDDYYIAFRETEKCADGDVTAFLSFFAKILVSSVHDVQGRIHMFIRMLALRDYYRHSMEVRQITKRQHDLLQMLLLKMETVIRLRDLHLNQAFLPLYRSVSEKTARRDLDRLSQLQLLLRDENGYHLNPFALDG